MSDNEIHFLLITLHTVPMFFVKIQNLKTYYLIEETQTLRRAVDGVSFDIKQGEIFAITGSSGSGKTTLARSLLSIVNSFPGVINLEFFIEGNSVVKPLNGFDKGAFEDDKALLRKFKSRHFRNWQRNSYQKPMEKLRGKNIFMLFQEPQAALHPYLPVGKQIAECFKIRNGGKLKGYRNNVMDVLKQVKLTPEKRYYDAYPKELSIGECQRVLIAMSLAIDAGLVIADEPTTKLDKRTQQHIVDILKLKPFTMLLITHELGVINALADRIAVMYEGKIVEIGTREQIFSSNHNHPYTEMLLSAYKNAGKDAGKVHFPLVRQGCKFAPRCTYVEEVCLSEEPELKSDGQGHKVRCSGRLWH